MLKVTQLVRDWARAQSSRQTRVRSYPVHIVSPKRLLQHSASYFTSVECDKRAMTVTDESWALVWQRTYRWRGWVIRVEGPCLPKLRPSYYRPAPRLSHWFHILSPCCHPSAPTNHTWESAPSCPRPPAEWALSLLAVSYLSLSLPSVLSFTASNHDPSAGAIPVLLVYVESVAFWARVYRNLLPVS